MKKQRVNLEEKEAMSMAKKGIFPTDPNDPDTPKPDGESSSTSEGEDEDDKPGGNIFK